MFGAGAKASLQGPSGEQPVCYELTVNCDTQEVALLSEALGATSAGDASAVDDRSDAIARVPGEAIVGTEDGGRPATPGTVGWSTTHLEVPQRGDVEICVLGPVEVIGGDPGALESSRRMAALALLAYMALHGRPVSADELGSNLWPLDATRDDLGGPQRKTVMNVLSRARARLGYGVGGRERLIYSPVGYLLAEDVTSDWVRFERFVANSRQQAPLEAIASLKSSAGARRGAPFGGRVLEPVLRMGGQRAPGPDPFRQGGRRCPRFG